MVDLFTYGFFTHAMITALLASVTCGLIGTYIVTRRLVFITGGITHASFGGLGIAYYLGAAPLVGAGIFAVLSAVGVQYLSNRNRIRVDSAIAMAWSFGMAVGIIFIFITPGYAPNLMSYLFGSILTVSRDDLIIMAVLAVIVVAIFILLFRSILYISFDEEFARSQGLRVNLLNYLLMILVAITAVLYIRVAGIILVLSLLTVPQNTAMLFSNSLSRVMLLSIGFGILGTSAGLILSYYLNIPSGAAIIFTLLCVYFFAWGINRMNSLFLGRS